MCYQIAQNQVMIRLRLTGEVEEISHPPLFFDGGDILDIHAAVKEAPVLIELYRVNFDPEDFPYTRIYAIELDEDNDSFADKIVIIKSTSYFFRMTCLKTNQKGCAAFLSVALIPAPSAFYETSCTCACPS